MAMINKSREIQRAGDKEAKKSLKLTDMFIPLLGFVIFLLLTFFVYIPSISQAIDMQGELDKSTKDKQSLDQLSAKLLEQDSATYQKDFQQLNIILPEKLEVAEFAYYVDKLAIEKGLTLNELRASNTIVASTSTASAFDGKKVSGPVKYVGRYVDIMSFLDDMQTVSPYLISMDNLQVSKVMSQDGGGDLWSLEMSISAIYNGDQSVTIPKYTSYKFIPYSDNADSLLLLINRAKKIVELTQ